MAPSTTTASAPHGYRLGIEVGTNSIGWCVLRLNADKQPDGILAGPGGVPGVGVRIFPSGRDPKTELTLASIRRMKRSMRRFRERYVRRRRNLERALTRHGLLPVQGSALDGPLALGAKKSVQGKSLFDVDPYEIRAVALDEEVHPYLLGRAIFHLNQRRGFKSNRKTDQAESAEDDAGKIKKAIAKTSNRLEATNSRTVGELLWKRKKEGKTVRVRMGAIADQEQGVVQGYELFMSREQIECEFEALWESQERFHPDLLSETAHEQIHQILFFQRPLKPVDPGQCTFEPHEKRLARAHPLFQERRILQQLNHLQILAEDGAKRSLTPEQRDKIKNKLMSQKQMTFQRMKTLLSLSEDESINFERENWDALKGDEIYYLMTKSKHLGNAWKECGKAWTDFSSEEQQEIIELLIGDEQDEDIIRILEKKYEFPAELARKMTEVSLPRGYGNIGITATRRIVAELQKEVITYDEAARNAGYDSSDFRPEEIRERLPYYGEVLKRHVMRVSRERLEQEGKHQHTWTKEDRYGRMGNPTLHIGLNQLRRIVNELIRYYGHPTQIVLELARDLKNDKGQKDRYKRQQNKNLQRRKKHDERLEDLGQAQTRDNRCLLELWDELQPNGYRCPYTGETISCSMLFSGAVEVQHILPRSDTLDDSMANRTLCIRAANREKGSRTPYQAFGNTEEWDEIFRRSRSLPLNKRWRFEADAHEKWEEQGGFLARQLTDTQYLARITREYLCHICDPSQVWVIPGRLTAELRRAWGLNSVLDNGEGEKNNREDHRHHAVDAIVIANTDRAMLQRIATYYAQCESYQPAPEFPKEPWPDFRQEVKEAVGEIVVSHKSDHGNPGVHPRQSTGALHNETAYGILAAKDGSGKYKVTQRIAIKDLKMKDVEKIHGDVLRGRIAKIRDKSIDNDDFQNNLATFSKRKGFYKGISHVRIRERKEIIPIKDESGRAYKGYLSRSNDRFDVYEVPGQKKWVADVVSKFDAHQQDRISPVTMSDENARKIMSLHINDMVVVEIDGEREIYRVKRSDRMLRVSLAVHYEGGESYITRRASGLQKIKVRKVYVSPAGRVYDGGQFHE